MINRRQSKLVRTAQGAFARLWQAKRVGLLIIPYLVLLSWLFSGDGTGDLRPGSLYAVSETPEWKSPDREHWFGTTANGEDLFELSRLAMAASVAVAVVAVVLGSALSLIATMLFFLGFPKSGLVAFESIGRAGFVLPPMVVSAILCGAGRGSLGQTIAGLTLVIAFGLATVISGWLREGMSQFHFEAGLIIGLEKSEITMNRLFPAILRRLPGVMAKLLPVIVLVEMALSFAGLTGDRLSCGVMIAYGQSLIIEAPWMVIYPGVLATIVVMALSFLGWRVSGALKTGNLIPII